MNLWIPIFDVVRIQKDLYKVDRIIAVSENTKVDIAALSFMGEFRDLFDWATSKLKRILTIF